MMPGTLCFSKNRTYSKIIRILRSELSIISSRILNSYSSSLGTTRDNIQLYNKRSNILFQKLVFGSINRTRCLLINKKTLKEATSLLICLGMVYDEIKTYEKFSTLLLVYYLVLVERGKIAKIEKT